MDGMKIGIFGGTFDPPTIAHLNAAKIFIKELQLDELWFVPAKQNVLKHLAFASPMQRLEMSTLLVEGEEKMCITDIEVNAPGPSYSYNTIKALEYTFPKTEFWLLGGSDILTNFTQWHKVEKLVKLCRVGILLRLPDTMNVVYTRIPNEFRNVVDIINHPMPDISSTEVRTKMKEGKPVSHLLKPSVYDYIVENQIYSSQETVEAVK